MLHKPIAFPSRLPNRLSGLLMPISRLLVAGYPFRGTDLGFSGLPQASQACNFPLQASGCRVPFPCYRLGLLRPDSRLPKPVALPSRHPNSPLQASRCRVPLPWYCVLGFSGPPQASQACSLPVQASGCRVPLPWQGLGEISPTQPLLFPSPRGRLSPPWAGCPVAQAEATFMPMTRRSQASTPQQAIPHPAPPRYAYPAARTGVESDARRAPPSSQTLP